MNKQTCPECPRGCRPIAVNAIGVTIEEHRQKAGWVAVGQVHPTYCAANKLLAQIPTDTIERRVYTAFAPPST